MIDFEKTTYRPHFEKELSFEKELKVISFQNGCELIIDKSLPNELVQMVSQNGDIVVTIDMTNKDPVIRFSGATIQLNAKEKIEITSPTIEIKAKKRLKLESAGNLDQVAGGDFREEIKGDAFRIARIQHITADLGNVNIQANDDVRLDGERVKLNCDSD